ncbi:10873_t:CDS:2, partial [Dentiscutata heterogama]
MPNTSTTKQDRKVKKARTLDTNKASNDGAENKENIDFAKVSQNTTQNADNNNSKDLNIKQVVTDTRTESETTKETTVAREKNTSLAPQDNTRQNLAKQTEHVADNNHVSDQQAEPEGHVTDNGHEMDLADDQSNPANPYVTNEEHNMNIEKLEKISASTTTKMDEEVEPELAWAEMAEAENQFAQSQTIQIESPDMETSPTQN